MEALLRVEHLKKQFHRNSDGTYVLKDISFEMMPGECLGLIGNSGSGKSTIVKILTGITTATKGCIYLEGKQISGKRRRMPLFHFDMYRLSSSEELFDIGWEDYLTRGGVCAVEWSEQVSGALPEDAVWVDIARGDNENDRIITITGGEGL